MILNNKAEVDERIVIVPHRPHSFSLTIGRAAYHKDGNVLFLFEMGDDLAVPERSVNAVFGENKNLFCYPRDVQTAAFLINLTGDQFINYQYNFRREMEGQIVTLDEQDGLPRKLTHYGDELEIDTGVFQGIDLIPFASVDNYCPNR